MSGNFEIIELKAENVHRVLKFTHEAMAAVFSIMIIQDDQEYAHQAVTEAWKECDRLEAELSRFIENSDISRLNILPLNEKTTISIDTFECLHLCSQLIMTTEGAFDVTLGTRSLTSDSQTPPFMFNPDNYSVIRLDPDAQIDLGGFAKGYAVDRIAEILEEWEITTALISGGRSSVLALDPPPGESGWEVSISHPVTGAAIRNFTLNHQCLSGSGMEKGDHIVNPRTGQPVTDRIAAWSLCPNAAEGDALSTAFMVMGEDAVRRFCAERDDYGAVILSQDGVAAEFD